MCDRRDLFCFICGLYTDHRHKLRFDPNHKVIPLYEQYFGKTYMRDQWYIPQICCTTCYAILRCSGTESSKIHTFTFCEPVAWLPQRVHRPNNCYFCLTDTKGHHFKTRKNIKYAVVDSVIQPIFREERDITPHVGGFSPLSMSVAETTHKSSSSSEFLPPGERSSKRHYVSKEEFHDLVRDLHLSKAQIELLGSRMQQWNFLDKDVSITFSRSQPTNEFESMFSESDCEPNLVYCNDVNILFNRFGVTHDADEWRLFIDGSMKSKALNLV